MRSIKGRLIINALGQRKRDRKNLRFNIVISFMIHRVALSESDNLSRKLILP